MKAARETVNCGRYWPSKEEERFWHVHNARSQCYKPWKLHRDSRRDGISFTQHTQGDFSMFIFRHLADWAFTRLFWLCLLGSTAQADVILWDAPFTGSAALTPVAGGEIRSQAIDLATAATAKTITLSIGQPPWWAGTGGPSQISLWLDSTPAERKTLIYSGAFRNSWSGLAVELPKGRSFLSLENLAGSRTINWNQQMIGGVVGSFMGSITGTPVPEPGAVVLLICCCAAGIFYAWRGRRGV